MTPAQLEAILARLPDVRICVVGDLFLDKYLDIDPALSEVSIETGLAAHQVTGVRCYAGAAGTVANSLAALGVGHVALLGVIGDDGEGYDVRQAARRVGIDDSWLLAQPCLRTPTYTKPLLRKEGHRPVELSRLDIKNRQTLPQSAEDWVIDHLEAATNAFDAIVIGDQVQERNCGVITDRVRQRIAELAEARREVCFLADSRCRIGEFRHVIIKPNRSEAITALADAGCGDEWDDMQQAALRLGENTRRPVYLTVGAQGLVIADQGRAAHVPAFQVTGEIDIVGAGDSTTAGIVAALCAGAATRQAGLVGCLVASITVQEIGVTGSASPCQIRRRFAEYLIQHPEEVEQPDTA